MFSQSTPEQNSLHLPARLEQLQVQRLRRSCHWVMEHPVEGSGYYAGQNQQGNKSGRTQRTSWPEQNQREIPVGPETQQFSEPCSGKFPLKERDQKFIFSPPPSPLILLLSFWNLELEKAAVLTKDTCSQNCRIISAWSAAMALQLSSSTHVQLFLPVRKHFCYSEGKNNFTEVIFAF